MRHGLDMAFSENLNQLALWGEDVLGQPVELTPKYALAYWVKVHENLDIKLSKFKKTETLIIHFEDLCEDPHSTISKILKFSDVKTSANQLDALCAGVNRPDTFGRYKHYDLSQLNKDDIKSLEKFNYHAIK